MDVLHEKMDVPRVPLVVRIRQIRNPWSIMTVTFLPPAIDKKEVFQKSVCSL